MKVSNLISKSGNNVANQFEILTDTARFFQSYDSIIAKDSPLTTSLNSILPNGN